MQFLRAIKHPTRLKAGNAKFYADEFCDKSA